MRAFIALMLMTTSAGAATCAPHADFTETLRSSFGEDVRVQALEDSGLMMEVLSKPETGSWSVLMTSPDGLSCLVASGVRYIIVKPGQPA